MTDELTWLPAWRMRELFAARELSPVEVLDHFLARIAEFDPTLRAFATLDEKGARAQAHRAEKALTGDEPLGPLHGVPISVKEHIAVAGVPLRRLLGPGQETTATNDDLGVERLRGAGAVIVGTNTMMGTASEQPGTYNWEREARNPWDPSRVPGWSSSGGAATAAARLLPIAIGSDGGGSTRLPAAYCGIVGLHMTRGRVPYIDYQAPSHMLTISTGPLCRDVRDAATTAHVMAQPDGRDFVCIQDAPDDYLATLDAGVEGMRLAWTDDFGYASMYAAQESPRVIEAVRTAAWEVTSLGADIEPTTEKWEDFWLPYVTTSQALGDGPMAAGAPRPTPERYQAAAETRSRIWERFRRLLGTYDVLLSTTSQLLPRTVEDWNTAWTTPDESMPHGMFAPHYTSHTQMFNWLGWPAVSVPCGFVDGLPIGLQIIGWPGSEAKILRVAAAYQHLWGPPAKPPIA